LASLDTTGSPEDQTNPNPTDPHASPTRRSSRAQLRSKQTRAAKPSRAERRARAPKTRDAASTHAAPATKRRVKGSIINVAVLTIAGGIVATMALPAYAFNPDAKQASQFGTSAIDGMKKANSQSVRVAAGASGPAVSREAFTATSEAELQAQKAAAQAAAARAAAAAEMEAYAASYSGPSVSDFLANPPYPNFSLDQVFSVAQQYIGTPYVYGGASPAGFDCSGYVMFVYAQFGISLPHSVSGQAAAGTRISIEDAVPGDLVIMDGHDGFYAGNGNIMDAPDVGRSISIRPIWTSDYYIVRLGI
jgi:cell wall-associated NlpC family hydrolase